MKALRLIGQILTWAALGAFVAALAQGPGFAPYGHDQALIKFSLAHLSERLVPCRKLTEAERQELPPTRRVSELCERGRAPTIIELELDGEMLIDRRIEPAGLSDDGRAYYLEFFPVPAGEHELMLRLRDTPRNHGFDIERKLTLQLAPGDAALVEVADDGVLIHESTRESQP